MIDNEVRFLKGLWLTGISVFAIWFIYLSGKFEKKEKNPAFLVSSIYFVIFVIAIYVYIERFNFMKSVIEGLIA